MKAETIQVKYSSEDGTQFTQEHRVWDKARFLRMRGEAGQKADPKFTVAEVKRK